MKFDLIEKLLISKLNKVNKNDYRYNFYKTQIKELKEYKVEIYDFKKIKKLLKVYKNKDVIDLCFDYLDEYLIYGSYIHGINHNLRVLVHSIILSSLFWIISLSDSSTALIELNKLNTIHITVNRIKIDFILLFLLII